MSPPFHTILTPDNDMTEEFNMRIGRARGVFFKLTRRLWNQRCIRKVTKTRLFNAVVSSTLLYGAGTWTRKEQQTKRLESAQYRLARYMLGTKPMDHVRMTRAYEELGMIPLRVLLVRHNLAWAARIINYDESRLPWVVMYSQMACGRRRRGHPHQ